MKKLVLTLTATLACVAAFAQGKISFQNDSLHLVYFDPNPANLAPGDAALAGQATAVSSNQASGVTLAADLYMGTSSSVLSLYSSTTFNAAAPGPGKWGAVSVQAINPLVLGGTPVFVEAQVRDSSFAPPSTFTGQKFGTYYGASQMFTFTLGSSSVYPVMWSQTQGNWAPGSFNMDTSAYGTGARGAIDVATVPEPSSFVLAGLGAAALLVFRRRK